MTTVYTSNFDSDVSGALPSGWANKTGTWAVTTSNPVSGANAFGSSTNVDGDAALYTGATATADMRISTSQKLVLNTSRLPTIGHILRADSANANNYTVVFNNTTPSSFNVLFFKKVGGTYSQLGTAVTVNLTRAAGDTFNITTEIIGNTINVYAGVNAAPGGTAIASKTDASITAAGYAGLYYAKDSTSVSGMSVDNIVLDNAAASSDTTAPTMVPSSLSSSSITATGFTLSWSAASDNVAVTGYEYSTDNGGSWSDAGNVLSKTVTGLAQNTLYHTQVRAYDAAGNKSTALSLDVTTASSADATAPTMNGVLASSNVTSAGFTITWSAASDNVAVTGYEYSINGGSSWVDVGNVLTANVTGLAAGTQYNPQVRAYDAAGNRAAAISTTVTTSVAQNNALTNGTGNVLFSPFNWNVGTSTAKTINAGAYFRTLFTGTTCTLQFDMTGVASPLPQISYQVDGTGAWTTVPIAATVAITVPSSTSDYAAKGGHLLEVVVKSMTETQPRWSTQSTAVSLTGIILDAGATLTQAASMPLRALYFGDSITEGVRTLNKTAPNDTDRNDARQGWAYHSARMLGAEAGFVGFGGSGFTVTGSGSVPVLATTYNQIYSGVSRSFAQAPDFIVLMEGTNDSADVTSAATTVLNGLLAATPAATKIIVLRPFKDATHATQLQNAIAACTTPGRVTYVDTSGWFNTTNSSDLLHPYGNENINHIAPLAAAAIRTALASTGTTAARTVTLTLGDTSGPLANLSGIKVAAFDQPTPDLRAAPLYKSSSQTTDANGVLTFTMQSTLAVGAACGVSVQLADGRNFDVSTTVA